MMYNKLIYTKVAYVSDNTVKASEIALHTRNLGVSISEAKLNSFTLRPAQRLKKRL